MRPQQRYQQQQRGFSLIELAIVLVISSVVGGAIYQTFHTQQKTYQRQNALAAMQQNVRAATFNMIRELRMAGYDPTVLPVSGDPNYTFGFETQFPSPHDSVTVDYAVDTDKIAFSVDTPPSTAPDALPGNNVLDLVPAELIAYRFNRAGHALERYIVGSGWQAVAEDVDGVHFAYFDEDGNTTTIPANIQSVEVSLVFRAGQKDLAYHLDKDPDAAVKKAQRMKGGRDICTDCAAEPHYRRQFWSTRVQIRNRS